MVAVESDYLLLAAYCIIFYLGGMGKADFRETESGLRPTFGSGIIAVSSAITSTLVAEANETHTLYVMWDFVGFSDEGARHDGR